MNFTLHLSNKCNMACKYCDVKKNPVQVMKIETIRNIIDMPALDSSESTGIIFFGGEPLLNKDLIYQTIEYCNRKKEQEGRNFHFQMTTNGLLLDEDFLDYAAKEKIWIALSHDGIEDAHDKNRVDCNGKDTFSKLSQIIDILLKVHPYAPVMMVVNPDTVYQYSQSVKYLFNRGFKYIIPTLNYTGDWSEQSLKILEKEYEKLAVFYSDMTISEEKFYFSPFDSKISSHINKIEYCKNRCQLGKRQISVDPEGNLFPCVQFVGDSEYIIGHAETGVDETKRQKLYTLNSEEKKPCTKCAIRERCNHYCGCLNKMTTGKVDEISPVLCAHERILIPIADKLAEKLFKKRSAMFIHKHYNDAYSFISVIEDIAKTKR